MENKTKIRKWTVDSLLSPENQLNRNRSIPENFCTHTYMDLQLNVLLEKNVIIAHFGNSES